VSASLRVSVICRQRGLRHLCLSTFCTGRRNMADNCVPLSRCRRRHGYQPRRGHAQEEELTEDLFLFVGGEGRRYCEGRPTSHANASDASGEEDGMRGGAHVNTIPCVIVWGRTQGSMALSIPARWPLGMQRGLASTALASLPRGALSPYTQREREERRGKSGS